MDVKTRMARELITAAEHVLSADYIHDPDHKKKPRGGNWHRTNRGWSNIPKTKLAPISFDDEKPANNQGVTQSKPGSASEIIDSIKSLKKERIGLPLGDSDNRNRIGREIRGLEREYLKPFSDRAGEMISNLGGEDISVAQNADRDGWETTFRLNGDRYSYKVSWNDENPSEPNHSIFSLRNPWDFHIIGKSSSPEEIMEDFRREVSRRQ